MEIEMDGILHLRDLSPEALAEAHRIHAQMTVRALTMIFRFRRKEAESLVSYRRAYLACASSGELSNELYLFLHDDTVTIAMRMAGKMPTDLKTEPFASRLAHYDSAVRPVFEEKTRRLRKKWQSEKALARTILKLDLSFWPAENGFKPLRFEWRHDNASSPFALLRYALDGKEQELGIRFDLGKQAALDNLDDSAHQAALKSMTPMLCAFLAEHHFLWPKWG